MHRGDIFHSSGEQRRYHVGQTMSLSRHFKAAAYCALRFRVQRIKRFERRRVSSLAGRPLSMKERPCTHLLRAVRSVESIANVGDWIVHVTALLCAWVHRRRFHE